MGKREEKRERKMERERVDVKVFGFVSLKLNGICIVSTAFRLPRFVTVTLTATVTVTVAGHCWDMRLMTTLIWAPS